jgi:molybdopterin/thiamine biosynthesis adenylyltransferase
MKEINGLRILGVGGVGGAVLEPVLRYFTYSHRQGEMLDVTLVDGDEYEAKNLVRQAMSEDDIGTNKAQAAFDKLSKTFGMLDIQVFPQYLTSDNIAGQVHDGDVVLMSFDNFKSKKMVADHCATLDNVILISGGNEWIDGNVQIYIRENGVALTANLPDYHPEIEFPKDKSPDEIGCAEAMVSAPQLLAMNLTVAAFMFNSMYFVLNREDDDELKDRQLYGEVYVDIAENKARPCVRNPRPAATTS